MSNGHNVDSPMSTKYFTPEFRADVNYILDYNHPEDDSMGGSTEMFRSDEFQLEQVSIGGDIRIQQRARAHSHHGRIVRAPPLCVTTPATTAASGTWPAPTSTSLRHGAAITGMWVTA
jgi:hypothetical protein